MVTMVSVQVRFGMRGSVVAHRDVMFAGFYDSEVNSLGMLGSRMRKTEKIWVFFHDKT